jgi:hypothetical protein
VYLDVSHRNSKIIGNISAEFSLKVGDLSTKVFNELPTLIDLLVMTLKNSKTAKFSQKKKDFS